MYGFWGAYFAAVTPRSTPLSAPGAVLTARAVTPAFGAGENKLGGPVFGTLSSEL